MERSNLEYDQTRRGELAKFARDQHDPTKPDIVRKRAAKAQAKVKTQTTDTRLNWMRSKLAAATRAGDMARAAEWEYNIKEYMREHRNFEDWR
jgi:hypothetical protein